MLNFENQIMKFYVTENGIEMRISYEDLKFALANNPNNTYDGENIGIEILEGKEIEFGKWLVDYLQDDYGYETSDTNWSRMISNAFQCALEGAEEHIFKYSEF